MHLRDWILTILFLYLPFFATAQPALQPCVNWDPRNCYEILQVNQNASADDIRTAFRKQVMLFHPDQNPDNPEALNQIKLIIAAGEILKDPGSRHSYDNSSVTLAERMHRFNEDFAERMHRFHKDFGERQQRFMSEFYTSWLTYFDVYYTKMEMYNDARVINFQIINELTRLKIRDQNLSPETLARLISEIDSYYKISPDLAYRAILDQALIAVWGNIMANAATTYWLRDRGEMGRTEFDRLRNELMNEKQAANPETKRSLSQVLKAMDKASRPYIQKPNLFVQLKDVCSAYLSGTSNASTQNVGTEPATTALVPLSAQPF